MAVSDERSKIPDLMKIGQLPSDISQDVDTEVLDPVVVNDNFCRFVLTNKGFLHSFSKIVLSLNDTGTIGGATFPVNVGVHSLVQRCALRIGTTIVAEIDDFNHWMGYKSLFIDNDINYERETFLTSRLTATELVYDNTLNESSNINASIMTLKTHRETTQTAAGLGGEMLAIPEINLENTPEFSVSVADLFPFLRFNQLPLYMINQQVSIELHFQPSSTHKRIVVEGAPPANLAEPTINTPSVKFIADYIYYDGDLMEQYRNQNQMMNWTYTDYRLNKRSFTKAQLEESIIMDVGGAGRLCNKVITAVSQTLTTPDDSLLNEYTAISPDKANNNMGVLTNNLVYNDNRLYPIDRKNPAIHFHDLVQTEQNIPHICRDMWSKGGNGLSSVYKYMEHSVSSKLAGQFFYIGYRLNRNERVNSKGIQLEFKYSLAPTGNFIHRSWLELVKTATLNNGMFSTEYA